MKQFMKHLLRRAVAILTAASLAAGAVPARIPDHTQVAAVDKLSAVSVYRGDVFFVHIISAVRAEKRKRMLDVILPVV